MFLDEARIAAQLSHPNIVQTYEVVETGTRHYIVMEYLDGANLARLRFRARKRGGMPLRLSLQVLIGVLEGLDYAHSARGIDGRPLKVVHRDLTPTNIVITAHGEVKILDFGIAKAADSHSFTATGRYSGKLHYMPPEQLRAESPDNRADIFSVGVSLVEAIRNDRFWGAATGPMVASRLVQGDIPTLIGVEGVDPELARICARALAARRDERYPNAGAFKADLSKYLVANGGAVSREELGAFVAETVADDRARLQTVVDSQIQRLTQLSLSSNPPPDLPRLTTGDDDVIIEHVLEPGAQTPMPLPVAISNTPPPLRAPTITVPPRTKPVSGALPAIPSPQPAPALSATPPQGTHATITMLPSYPAPRITPTSVHATGTGRSASTSGLLPRAVAVTVPTGDAPGAAPSSLVIDDAPATEVTPVKQTVAAPAPVAAATAPSASPSPGPGSGGGAPASGDPPSGKPRGAASPSASSESLSAMPSAPPRARTPIYIAVGIATAAVLALVLVLVLRTTPHASTTAAAPPVASTPPPAPTPAPTPATAKLEVIVTPVDARLELDGKPLGANPFVGAFARDTQLHELVISAPGFDTMSRKFNLDQDLMLQLALQPIRRDPTPATPPQPVAVAPAVVSRPAYRPTAPTRPTPVVATPTPTPAPTPTPPQPAVVVATPTPAPTPAPGTGKRSLDGSAYEPANNKRTLDGNVYDSDTNKPSIDRENPWKK